MMHVKLLLFYYLEKNAIIRQGLDTKFYMPDRSLVLVYQTLFLVLVYQSRLFLFYVLVFYFLARMAMRLCEVDEFLFMMRT